MLDVRMPFFHRTGGLPPGKSPDTMRPMDVLWPVRARTRFRVCYAVVFVVLAMLSGACPAWSQNTGAPAGVRPPSAAQAPKSTPAGTNSLSRLPDAEAASAPPPQHPLVPARTEEGTIGRSDFRIDLPSGDGTPSAPAWNHELVIYFHGYQGEPQRFHANPLTQSPFPPSRLVEQLLTRGFAVAQPGYSSGGWAVASATADAEALRRYFIQHYGDPTTSLVVGQSMGGLLTVLSLERHPDEYAGGFSICGVLTPADLIMQRAFANRVAFDAFFPGLLPDVEHIPAGFRMNDSATATLIEKSLDAHAPEAALLRSLADIHTNRGLADVLVFNTFVIEDLREKAGGNPFDNRNLIYTGTTDDNALNARVRRYAADPQALAYVSANGSPSGQLHRPLLALHTIYDPLVPASTAGYYDEQTRRLGVGEFFVQQYVNRDGHCNVTPEQAALAFDELRSWAAYGVRPQPGRLPDSIGQRPIHQLPNSKPVQPKNIGKPQ